MLKHRAVKLLKRISLIPAVLNPFVILDEFINGTGGSFDQRKDSKASSAESLLCLGSKLPSVVRCVAVQNKGTISSTLTTEYSTWKGNSRPVA